MLVVTTGGVIIAWLLLLLLFPERHEIVGAKIIEGAHSTNTRDGIIIIIFVVIIGTEQANGAAGACFGASALGCP